MVSTNPTPQVTRERPLSSSLWVAVLAIFSAAGIVLRQITIPTFSPYVTLTPGFIMPLLAGIILGPLGGILCGFFVGISGALWEPFLIPLIGNIALGVSTGLPTHYRYKFHRITWMVVSILSAIVIGGFLPTYSIEVLVFGVPLVVAALTASIDSVQAGIWVVVAIILAQGVINPILFRYRRSKKGPE